MHRSGAEAQHLANVLVETQGPAAHLHLDGSPPHVGPQTESGFGRYVVIEEIGRGSTGVVMRAYDSRLRREVALKYLQTNSRAGSTTQRLLGEDLLGQAQVMANISHPNIVAVYDAELVGGGVVMAMEHVRGTTLERWLDEARPWREIVERFVGAGRGLAAAHAAGIPHGSFQTSKVLLGSDGRVRLAGFRLAQSQRKTHRSASASDDTIDIIIPSQGSLPDATETGSGGFSPAGDCHAFCAALWAALEKPATTDPPASRELDSSVPATIRDALRRGLSTDPAVRWPSMNALLDALAHVPRPARGRLVAAGLVVSLGLTGVAAAGHRAATDRRCSGAEKQLGAIWDETRSAAVERALYATGVVYVDDVWKRVRAELDAYANDWMSAHQGACEATTVRAEQSSSLMDLKMACLQRARVDLNAAIDVLMRADASTIEKAHLVTSGLPDLRVCNDVEALQAEVDPPAPAHAEEVETIRAELAASKALRDAGKYLDAADRVQAIVERARATPYAPLQSEVMLALGFARESAGALREAQECFEQALRIALSHRQWPLAQTAASQLIRNVGVQQTRPAEALAYAETAKALLPLTGPSGEPMLRNHMGIVLDIEGHHTAAERELRAAVELAERTFGPDHPTAAQYLGNVAVNLKYQGKLAEAEREQRQTLARLERTLAAEHPAVSSGLFDLGNILYAQGRYTDAEEQLLRAVAIRQKVFGQEHPDTASVRGALANAISSQGRYEEAEAEYRAVLAIQERAFGPEHVKVSHTHNSLGSLLAEVGRHHESEQHMRAALAIDEKTYGAHHPFVGRTRSYLATILSAAMRYDMAEVEARKALRIFASTLGERHPQTCSAHRVLATILHSLRRLPDAESEARAALTTAQHIFGTVHPKVALHRQTLGRILEAQQRHHDAEAEYREALAVQVAAQETEPRDIMTTRGYLGNVLRSARRYEEAEREYRAGLALQDEQHDSAYETAELQLGLARVLVEAKKPAEALSVFEEAWGAWKNDVRAATPIRARLAFGLARLLRKTDHHRASTLARTARRLFEPVAAAFPADLAAIDAWLVRHG